MRHNRVTNWFLLGYLVLFLNLGPAAHRAHFFGLHGHSHVYFDAQSNHCGHTNHCVHTSECGHSHTCTDSHSFANSNCHPSRCCSGADNQDSGVSVEFLADDLPDGQCTVCKFFDEFNLTVVNLEQPYVAAPVLFRQSLCCTHSILKVIAASARGPPIIHV